MRETALTSVALEHPVRSTPSAEARHTRLSTTVCQVITVPRSESECRPAVGAERVPATGLATAGTGQLAPATGRMRLVDAGPMAERCPGDAGRTHWRSEAAAWP